MFALLLPLHITCVLLLSVIFVWRVSYVWHGQCIPYAWLKRGLPDVLDVMALLSGLALAVVAGFAPWQDAWFAMKLLALLVYIGAGFAAFAAGWDLWLNRLGVVIALCMLIYIAMLAITKQILLGIV